MPGVGFTWADALAGRNNEEVFAAIDDLSGLPLAIIDSSEFSSVDDVKGVVHRLARETGERVLIIFDYLQKFIPTDTPDARLSASGVSHSLSAFARDYGHAVIAVSSVGRASYQLEEARGGLDWSRLLGASKESGGIEYDASLVVGIIAPKLTEDEESEAIDEGRRKVVLAIAKNRSGGPGNVTVPLLFDGKAGTHVELPEDAYTRRGRRSDADLEVEILRAVDSGECRSMNDIARRVGGSRERVLSIVRELVASGDIVRAGGVFCGATTPARVRQ